MFNLLLPSQVVIPSLVSVSVNPAGICRTVIYHVQPLSTERSVRRPVTVSGTLGHNVILLMAHVYVPEVTRVKGEEIRIWVNFVALFCDSFQRSNQ